MLNDITKARLRLPQPVQLQNISELTRAAKERNRDIERRQELTETLSFHVDFSAESSPDPESSTTYV